MSGISAVFESIASVTSSTMSDADPTKLTSAMTGPATTAARTASATRQPSPPMRRRRPPGRAVIGAPCGTENVTCAGSAGSAALASA